MKVKVLGTVPNSIFVNIVIVSKIFLILIISLYFCIRNRPQLLADSRLKYTAVELKRPITVDGTISNKEWYRVKAVSAFTEIKTRNKETGPTSFMAGYDNDNLYIAFQCHDDDLVNNVTMKDGPVYSDDAVEVFIDVAGTGVHYYEFEVNPINTVFDAHIEFGEQIDFADAIKWNCAGLKTAVDTNAGGWSVEMKIPFAALGVMRPAKRSIWRINFYRIDINPGRASRYLAWSSTKNWFHEPQLFGTIMFGR